MDRNELIEKAKAFFIEPDAFTPALSELMADFALSLEAKDEWPQKGDEVVIRTGYGSTGCVIYDPNAHGGYLRQGRIERTEDDAIRANGAEAAGLPFIGGSRRRRRRWIGIALTLRNGFLCGIMRTKNGQKTGTCRLVSPTGSTSTRKTTTA